MRILQSGLALKLHVTLAAFAMIASAASSVIMSQDQPGKESNPTGVIEQLQRIDPDQIKLFNNPLLCGGVDSTQMPSFEPLQNIPKPGIKWSPTSPLPSWIKSAAKSDILREKFRSALYKEISIEFNGTPLNQAMQSIADQCGVQCFINSTELDLLGVDIETPITLHATEGTAMDVLPLILGPLDLTFGLTDLGIHVTSIDAAESEPVLRYYDMAWIMDTSDDARALINVIEQSVHPDSWINNGGTSSLQCIGQVLVVSAPDTTQWRIESLFANLARFRNVDEKSASTDSVKTSQN